MQIALGLLALGILGADGPSSPVASLLAEMRGPIPVLNFQFRVLEVRGVDWRAGVHTQMQTVARQGGATVWTAPAEVAERLVQQSKGGVTAPRLVVGMGQTGQVQAKSDRKFVADVERHADGPVNHASYVAYAPRFESAPNGFSAKISGRKLDQGVLARVEIEDRRVATVHTVRLTEVQGPRESDDGKTPWKAGVQIEVPEVARAEVSGEWLIPNDGVLVVSLGAYTVAEPDGKASVRERLAIVEARAHTVVGAMAPALRPPSSPVWLPAARPISAAFRASDPGMFTIGTAAFGFPYPLTRIAPPLPSRSLPEPIGTDGRPVALPPLPFEVSPPTSLAGTSDPCATPQTRPSPSTTSAPAHLAKIAPPILVDPATTHASFSVEPPICTSGGSCCSKDTLAETRVKAFPNHSLADLAKSANDATNSSCRFEAKKDVVLRIPIGVGTTLELRVSNTSGTDAPTIGKATR